jgi:catechol 2,3-dioxygenase-like lactoylglutathione lyase family enzyme
MLNYSVGGEKMNVEKIDHIMIIVKDIEATAKFFSDILGSQWIGPRDTGLGFSVAFDNLGFELMQPTAPGNPVAEHLEKYGEGVAYVGLKVPNVEETVAELQGKGIKAKGWRDVFKGDVKAVKTEDPDKTHGVKLEFVEYKTVPTIAFGNWRKISELPWMKL